MRFNPLGRAEQSGFLSVPCRIDNRAFWFPAAPHEFADCARLLHLGHKTADGIVSAVDPGVVMIASDNPFVWSFAAAKLRYDIIGRNSLPIEFELEMDCGRPRPQVIRNRECA